MIVFGTRLFGWCDEVEGQGQVATQFFHLMFIPILPLGSSFMVTEDSGISIGLSMKSLFVAYSRSFCFWSALAGIGFGVTSCLGVFGALSTGRPGVIMGALGSAVCTLGPGVLAAVFYFVIRMLTMTASDERAAELLEEIRA